MPIFTPEQLHHTGLALFRAAGASAEEAQMVMEHLVGANLAGGTAAGELPCQGGLESQPSQRSSRRREAPEAHVRRE